VGSGYPAWEPERRDMAARNRDLVAARMRPAQIAEVQERAREWKSDYSLHGVSGDTREPTRPAAYGLGPGSWPTSPIFVLLDQGRPTELPGASPDGAEAALFRYTAPPQSQPNGSLGPIY